MSGICLISQDSDTHNGIQCWCGKRKKVLINNFQDMGQGGHGGCYFLHVKENLKHTNICPYFHKKDQIA